jgi:hypothetical protein
MTNSEINDLELSIAVSDIAGHLNHKKTGKCSKKLKV